MSNQNQKQNKSKKLTKEEQRVIGLASKGDLAGALEFLEEQRNIKEWALYYEEQERIDKVAAKAAVAKRKARRERRFRLQAKAIFAVPLVTVVLLSHIF